MVRTRTIWAAPCVALAIGSLGLNDAYADVTCTETVTNLFVHSNGNVYFTTSETCSSWCEISFATSAANNQAYAMLLSAHFQGLPVIFDWPNLTSCSTLNAVYAIPGWVDL